MKDQTFRVFSTFGHEEVARMATTTTKSSVTACDNALYLIALPATSPTNFASSEIAHLCSGFSNPVQYSVIPQSILAAGSYTLVMVGAFTLFSHMVH